MRYVQHLGRSVVGVHICDKCKRIDKSLEENSNPPYEIDVINFFNLKLYKKKEVVTSANLTARQEKFYRLIQEYGQITTKISAIALDVSQDTASNELNSLIDAILVQKQGVGKETRYVPLDKTKR